MLSELNRANGIITEFLALAKDKVTNESRNLNVIIKSLYPLLQAEALMNNKSIKLELTEYLNLQIDEKKFDN
ncbi:hypothetical protein KHA80_18670 [Anaerobacillus sp. HL2]|nr:hypothetical protein KHA80_18670 [Anaerobacillus sp. HL2]